MTFAAEFIIAALLVIGGGFGLIGSFGLLKLRDPMQRLHAPTKATTIGIGAALLASVLNRLLTTGQVSWHEIIVSIFLFLTAPLSALYLAKTHLAKTVDRSSLPPTATQAPWAELRRLPDEETAVPKDPA